MQEVKIIIPKFDNSGVSLESVVKQSVSNFCELFGGATVFDAKGYWVNENGRLFEDEVAVIVSSASNPESAKLLQAIARNVLEITDQEAVFVSYDGIAEIIEK